VTVHIYNSLH